jgi:hypothetical protein
MLIAAGLLLGNIILALIILSASVSHSRRAAGFIALSTAPILALGSIFAAGIVLSALNGLLASAMMAAILLLAMFNIFIACSSMAEMPGGNG